MQAAKARIDIDHAAAVSGADAVTNPLVDPFPSTRASPISSTRALGITTKPA